MPKIALELDLKQLEQAINQLKATDRITLVERLEQKTWGERFRTLVSQIDKRRKKWPLSQKEIQKLIRQARKERYASRT